MKQLHIKNAVGIKGEQLACQFLEKRGHKIIITNYLKKWGEIDIVSKKANLIHFTEVKSVSRERIDDISHETHEEYRPEENIHYQKLKRLSRVIQSYLSEYYGDKEPEWKFNAIIVYLDMKAKVARIKIIEDIVL